MRVTVRVDASVNIGSGHLMRCLVLADALREHGAECHFICRELADGLPELIHAHGHIAHLLPARHSGTQLATDCAVDAERTCMVLEALQPDWLIVDHYELGQEWERHIRRSVGRLMAIDDIGRPHLCDLLLDQNFPNAAHRCYAGSTNSDALLLLGPQFALVRPEFATLRSEALSRRDGSLRRLLVSMGGSDPEDETSKVLTGLSARGPSQCVVDVVVGVANPNRRAVESACTNLPNARLHVQTSKMAELMTAADCAFTAGGSTSWERCCLGLPALVTVVSSDQLAIAEALAEAGAHILMGWNSQLTSDDYAAALGRITAVRLREISASAAEICDGRGAGRVAERLHS